MSKKDIKLNLKSFRSSSEVYEFYRYVYENDLRFEALLLLKFML